MNIDEMKDRIARAEEIQRYTENRCEALEKENAELKKACDETQELLYKQIEATYKLDKENAELKADNDARRYAMAMSEEVEKQLREENEKLKETVTKMNNVITETFSNLTKAKEIIEKVSKMYRYSPRVEEIIEQAEQFLSEVEK